MIRRYIYIKFQLYGLHYWPSAVDEVKFLGYQHGHSFNFKLTFEVSHCDRDIEFFLMKAEVLKFLTKRFADNSLPEGILNFKSASCEHLAELLLNEFNALEVEVSEDNLDGAAIRSEDNGL